MNTGSGPKTGRRVLASVLLLSLVLAQRPMSLRGPAHDCADRQTPVSAAVVGPSGDSGAGCTHAVPCGSAICGAAVAPAVVSSGVLLVLSLGLTVASSVPAARLPRFTRAGPPTPPPNS
jgi:hypothetical protein